MRIALLLASLVLAFATGWLGHALWVVQTGPTVTERAVVVEEQVRKIAQLATVERRFSEFLTHKEVGYIDLPMFNKSVMLRATARVVMGFDLEGVSVVADERRREIRICDWPAPEELAFEIQSQYFDFDQGLFNGFETDELNALSEKLEATLRAKVDPAPLRVACYEQADEVLGLIRGNLEGTGWTLVVEGWPEDVPQDLPQGVTVSEPELRRLPAR